MQWIFYKMCFNRLIIPVILLFASFSVKGQRLVEQDFFRLPQDMEHEINIAEISNDAFRDIFYTVKINSDSIIGLLFLQTDTLSFNLKDTISSLASIQSFVTDLDNSGQADLIIIKKGNNHEAISALLNYNSLSGFQDRQILEVDSILDFSLDDFNNDGLKDLFIISTLDNRKEFSIYLQDNDLLFNKFTGLPDISKFLVSSLNADGFKDLLLFNEDKGEISLYLSRQYFEWDTLAIDFNWNIDHWEQTDINHDGRTDIMVAAAQDSLLEIYCLINQSGGFDLQKLYTSSQPVTFVSTGDFNNDGLYDILISGENENVLLKMNLLGELQQIDTLNLPTGLSICASGDIDDDGDLDWTGTGASQDSVAVYLLTNHTPEINHGPGYVSINNPVTIGDFSRFTWNRTTDDKTPSTSITYDFYIWSENESRYLVTSDYDLENVSKKGARNISRHGYTLYDTIYLASGLNSGRYYWGVAGVDNAYYSETDIRNCGGTGPCSNENFTCQCLEITRADTLVCLNDTLHLQFGSLEDSVVWGSLNNGEIGSGNSLKFPVEEDDEVYAVAIPKYPCNDPLNTCIRNYNLTVRIAGDKPEMDFFEPSELSVCQNKRIRIPITIPDSLLAYLSYSVFADNDMLDIQNPEILINQPTTITILARYANCYTLTDTLFIKPIVPPVITIEGNNHIFPGRSTILTASGADHYMWSPASSLNSPNTATVTASPEVSTTYSVRGWNTEGCAGENTYRVEIIPSVYIPELFTPNNDGNNDRLIIHGQGISRLEFSIYNGNGIKIFSTNSVNEATVYGWDGNVNGKPVEPGTYVWFIQGEFENGIPLTYLGKNKGEVKIVR